MRAGAGGRTGRDGAGLGDSSTTNGVAIMIQILRVRVEILLERMSEFDVDDKELKDEKKLFNSGSS